MNKAAKEARETVEAVDAAVAEAIEPIAEGRVVKAVGALSELGDQPPMRILCGSVIAVGLIGGDRKLAWTGFRMLAAHTLATAAKDFIKLRIDRARPRSRNDSRVKGDHRIRPGDGHAKEITSFPSGHTAGAVAAARAFARDYPDEAGKAYGAAAAVSLVQIPRSAHYPSDVVAGLLIAVAAEAVASALIDFVAEE